MASIYTYNDFENAAKQSGLFDQFSSADLKLAQSNPDAGMSILKYKKDYQNATTDEQRAMANTGAESVRSSYGNYTGGGDGGSFHLNQLSPSSFDGGEAPVYENRYDQTIQNLIGDVVNRPDFTYDYKNDDLYSQYKKAYTREGNRATADALGAAAAASGGLPSSYAVTAASQAGDYYASQLADKVPELYQLAYNKYISDHNMKLSDLSAVQGAEQNDYNKYLTDLTQFNTNRSFDYGQLMDEINHQTLERQETQNNALTAAQFGDYSFLNSLGINTDNTPAEFEKRINQINTAITVYEATGDKSMLEQLGINPNTANILSNALAQSGRTSPIGSGGNGSSEGTKKKGNDDDDDDDPKKPPEKSEYGLPMATQESLMSGSELACNDAKKAVLGWGKYRKVTKSDIESIVKTMRSKLVPSSMIEATLEDIYQELGYEVE